MKYAASCHFREFHPNKTGFAFYRASRAGRECLSLKSILSPLMIKINFSIFIIQ